LGEVEPPHARRHIEFGHIFLAPAKVVKFDVCVVAMDG
jgi:hypothetical protein